MSRETDFETIMEADATLMATLTGGVYTSAELGREGITRDTTAAFDDTTGYLLPCALVRQRALVPDGAVVDEEEQIASVAQRVEVYLYEDEGYTNIDAALARLFTLFYGRIISGIAPVQYAGAPVTRGRDEGALAGASMARQDWMTHEVQGD